MATVRPAPASPAQIERAEPEQSARSRAGWRPSAPILSSAAVTLAVLIGNALYLLGVRTGDPLVYYSGLARPNPGTLPGAVNIDPNYGWTSQALGHLAAMDWLHGQVPLWNHYEGLGQPLVGEMQSGAFFLPFILLQALPHGIIYFHVALELFAGFGTLLLLRSLRLSWMAATTGAILFALNGIFSVMLNAPFNPIAALPWVLYGVELIATATADRRRPTWGVWVTILSVGLMLLAGFPETTGLQLGFVALWAVVRLVKMPERRLRFAAWSVVGALGGLALASPALVAFLDFLAFGDTGPHQVRAAGVTFQPGFHYAAGNVATFLFPYLHGKLASANGRVVGVLAGYVTPAAVAAAALGLFGSKERLRNTVLAVLIAVVLLNQYGVTPVAPIVNQIPGLRAVLVAKYAIVLVEFVVVLWAAEGIHLLQRRRPRWRAVAPVALVALIGLLAVVEIVRNGRYLVSPTAMGTPGTIGGSLTIAAGTVVASALAAALVLVAVLVARRASARRRLLAAAVAAIVVVEAVGIFGVSQLAGSAPVAVDAAPAKYLATHLGTSRFFTLGPIQANYGSYFGAAELDFVDLPAPKATTNLVGTDLTTPATKDYFTNTYKPITQNLPVIDEKRILIGYFERQATYRSLAVKYLVTRPAVVTPEDATAHGLTRVFHGSTADIWLDSGAKPFYTVVSGSCRLAEETATSVSATCTTPATLVRRELYADGWSAETDGHRHLVHESGPLFQAIKLPQGSSRLNFSYVPPHFPQAAIVSLCIMLLGIGVGAFAAVRRLRTSR